MANQWTEDQLAAVENRGGTFLVSAAAGSGKTAVLVERVIRQVIDDKAPCDIDRFLIVTYTNAAAAEMRGKIADAVTARLAQDPQNNRLRRQLYLTHKAQITTVHSFCLGLIRENFTVLGLSPDFRIADENEGKVIREVVLEDVLEQFYDKGDEGFCQLVEMLSAGRDDKRLAEVILETYDKLQSQKRPQSFLEEIRQCFVRQMTDPAQTKWGSVLLKNAAELVRYGKTILQSAAAEMESCPEVAEKYLPAFAVDIQTADSIADALDNQNWDGIVSQLRAVSFAKLGQVRNFEDKEYLERLKATRQMWKDLIKKLQNDLICYTAQEIYEDDRMMAPAVCALADVTEAFMEAFAREKRRRNLVDFNDLEHFALELLTSEDSAEPSALARELSQRYTEIMVDEYQDTNAVQDAIFSAVSKDGRNIFMVGDVKQSIYRFRLANPGIFLEKYKIFSEVRRAQEGEPRKIILSKNFRSRGEVLESANYIFKHVMSEGLGDLDYTAQEYLYQGASFEMDDSGRYRTEFCVLDTKLEEAEEADDSGESPDKAMLEAQYVAGRIFGLLQEGFPVFDKELGRTRPAIPSDFVILLRSVSGKAGYYQRALENFSVAARADTDDGLLTTPEITAVVSLLSVIDNPRQDIPLIAVMRSPLFGFTESELAEIRLLRKKAEFYDAVRQSAQAGNQKSADFLKALSDFRLFAADMPVYQLIWYLYDRTGALGRYGVLKNGAARQKNLIAFFEQAKNYEKQGYRGLFRFVAFLRGMIEQGDDFPAPPQGESGGYVRIMSIHKSKGLEFPIVILADCAKLFNEDDLRKPVLIHPELGIGPKCRDLSRGIQYPSAQRLAIIAAARREAVSEELRVLYVAMTRPKEKLIITCAVSGVQAAVGKWASLAAMDEVPSYALASARSPAMWLILPMLRHPAAGVLRQLCPTPVPLDTDAPDTFEVKLIPASQIEPAEAAGFSNASSDFAAEESQKVCPVLTYEYGFLTDIPAKITATSLTNSFKAEETMENAPARKQEKTLRRPFFDQEKRGLTPSEIGVAHHMVMQFADFASCESTEGLESEIKRLANKRILSEQQAEALDRVKLSAFFQSELYSFMKNAEKLHREFKFSVLVPAEEYYPEAAGLTEEKLLLQGVIDCLVETGDGFTIVDFKTDRIRRGDAEERAARYAFQLAAYQRATEEIFQKKVRKKALFFFETGQTVFLD